MSAPVLQLKIDLESAEAKARAAHNRGLAEELRAKVAQAALGGSEKSRERHTARGKLLPRERVERLLDPGSPFLEIGQLAANGVYEDDIPGAGMIAGIGNSPPNTMNVSHGPMKGMDRATEYAMRSPVPDSRSSGSE